MISFLFFALLLSLLAAAFLGVPLLRTRARGARAPMTAAVALLLLLTGGLGLYAIFGETYWSAAPADAGTDQSIATLARHVEHEPDDGTGWLRLAEAYAGIGNYSLAQRCYESANRIKGGRDPDALAGMAEAMLMQEDPARSAMAGELLERALALDSHHPKALFYSAVIAFREGRLDVARERFNAMLALNPPDSVRTALQRQIEEIDAAMRQGPAPQVAARNSGTRIRLHVTLDPALSRQLPASGALFIFVRSADGGPPLAVRRTGLELPQDVELSAADSMVAERAVRPGQDGAGGARISASGSATPASGDLYGEVRAVAGSPSVLSLQIDRRNP